MYASIRTRSRVSHTLLSLITCLSVACATRHEAGLPCPAIEMGAVADTPTDSTRTVTVSDTTTILMSRTPLAGTADITSATASQTADHWAINFTVTDHAVKRVQDFTRQHVGSNLALVVDGRVRGTPRIASAITGNGYRIDGFERADAERMATAISTGCRH